MSMEYIRRAYGVPAWRGAKIAWVSCVTGDRITGTIVGSMGAYIRVRKDRSTKPKRVLTLHPTWNIEYLPDEQNGKDGAE